MKEKLDKRSLERLVFAETRRLVTKIFKTQIMVLEDMRFQHEAAVEKLREHLSPEQIESLNYLDFIRYSLLRKRILDNGNEGLRDLENFLENFEFKLKNNSVTYKNKKKE